MALFRKSAAFLRGPLCPLWFKLSAASSAAGIPRTIASRVFLREPKPALSVAEGAGIPQKFASKGFLSGPSCPSWFKLFAASTLTSAGRPIPARLSRKACPELVEGAEIPRKFASKGFLSGPKPALSVVEGCPSWFKLFAALAALALTSACRIDMHVQPRENPLSRNDFYSDQRSARPLVEGTVARGQLDADTYFYTGKIGNNPGEFMPFPVTKDVLARGRERFNIFCAPCHSRLGDGNGFVPSRGFARKPPSFHIQRLQKAPVGYFFDVITEGFGIMPDYASQIPPQDRWDIVAYVRALQLSQNATMADVPAGQPVPSEPPKFRDAGTGATLPVPVPQSNSKTEEQK